MEAERPRAWVKWEGGGGTNVSRAAYCPLHRAGEAKANSPLLVLGHLISLSKASSDLRTARPSAPCPPLILG